MVVIRLSRSGQKGTPVFKVLVQDRDAPLSGRFIEQVGTLRLGTAQKANAKKSDISKRYILELKTERYTHWVKKGAQPTPRLHKWVKEFKALENLTTDAPVAAATEKKTAAPKASKAPAAKPAAKSKK
jgi:small subunit ribosomal protein S16